MELEVWVELEEEEELFGMGLVDEERNGEVEEEEAMVK